jgi:hypothetical protein
VDGVVHCQTEGGEAVVVTVVAALLATIILWQQEVGRQLAGWGS